MYIRIYPHGICAGHILTISFGIEKKTQSDSLSLIIFILSFFSSKRKYDVTKPAVLPFKTTEPVESCTTDNGKENNCFTNNIGAGSSEQITGGKHTLPHIIGITQCLTCICLMRHRQTYNDKRLIHLHRQTVKILIRRRNMWRLIRIFIDCIQNTLVWHGNPIYRQKHATPSTENVFLHFCQAGILYIKKPPNVRLAPLRNSLETRWRPRWPPKMFAILKGYVSYSYCF